ncbi:MAG: hypothetical protein IKK81_02715 [Prevotella sp.]|nr:hypothetical protein [Prevotella sp.]
MKKLFTLLALMLMCSVKGSAAFVDIKVDFTNNKILTEAETNIISVGIKMNEDGTATRVAADDASANAVVTGKWHSTQHGLANFSATVKVDGPVKIGMGSCAWGGTVKVTNQAGEDVANSFNTNNGACWATKDGAGKNVIYTYYKGDATTLTIAGGSYTPYLSVEKVELEDIPCTMKVSFYQGMSSADGIFPTGFEVEDGKTFKIPANRTLYSEGFTLTGWWDGSKTYKIGEDITAVGDTELSLQPELQSNKVTLDERQNEVEIVWDFQQKNGAPIVAVQGKTLFWVAQAEVNGETIDVKMDIDATSGDSKVANGSWQDWCQINPGTKLTIPVIKGAVISFESYSATTTTTIAGDVINQGTTSPTYTYQGDDSTVDIVIGDGSYFRYVKVVLPIPPYNLNTYDTDFYGLYLPYQVVVPEGITAYTGTLSADQTTLTLSKVEGVIPANTAVLVKSNAVGEYTFNVSNEETVDAIANNSLQGVTVETAVSELAEEGKTVLTLGVADGIVAFRQPAAWTIKANKVYLLVDAASSAKIRIVEGEATGIEENYEFGIKNSDAATYDLSGRKVANPAKGLYIKSGKKFIVK